MKPLLTFYGRFLIGCGTLLFCTGMHGQAEKQKVRVSVSYSCIMPETSRLTIAARFRGEDGFEPATNLDFEVYNLFENDSAVTIGNTTTNQEGIAVFPLKDLSVRNADSTGTYNYTISSLEHPDFSKVSKSISFKKATLDAYISEGDDLSFINATLTDDHTGEAVMEVPLRVQVQRLFRPMRVGDEFNMTDESGSIRVPVESGIPGLNGKLNFEVVLADNDSYGTITAPVEAQLGEPITDRSTFDQRTMWAPPSKTPLFLLTFPNLMIIGIWGTIVFLIINLYRIYKS